jgi:hypothetical protein
MLLSSCGRGNDENEISNTGTSQIEDNTDSPIII